MGKKDEGITALEIEVGTADIHVVGLSPLILNRMSEKAMRELLSPAKKLSKSEKESRPKHYPLEEYRSSAYIYRNDEDQPTRLKMLTTAFKGAIRSVATDMPGAAKSQIGRLTYIEGEFVPVFGKPKMLMSAVRSAGMNKVPDIRTRAIVPAWAARFSLRFTKPILNEKVIGELVAAAGIMRGIGDWRPEKGSGNFGQFRMAEPDDPQFVAISKIGREMQDQALAVPDFYDLDTQELFEFYQAETARRGFRRAV